MIFSLPCTYFQSAQMNYFDLWDLSNSASGFYIGDHARGRIGRRPPDRLGDTDDHWSRLFFHIYTNVSGCFLKMRTSPERFWRYDRIRTYLDIRICAFVDVRSYPGVFGDTNWAFLEMRLYPGEQQNTRDALTQSVSLNEGTRSAILNVAPDPRWTCPVWCNNRC